MEIIQAYFTNHPCMGQKKREIHPVGILVHSTGAVNRELRRYVDEPERLGKNQYNNHWNKENATKSVHAFIGYDKGNQVIVAETLPHDVACWGCGSGKKGSYNYDPHAYLQFEICQGSTSDLEYYWAAIKVAEDYCAHLCRIYGWTADNITSHAEASRAGYASNHGDPVNWMRAFGDDMDKFRMRVRALLEKPEDCTIDCDKLNESEGWTLHLAKVTCPGAYLNLRLYKDKGATVLKKLKKGSIVDVLYDSDPDWWYVRHGGVCGYAMTHSGELVYLTLIGEEDADEESDADKPAVEHQQSARDELVEQMRACYGRIQQEMAQMDVLIEAVQASLGSVAEGDDTIG